jgi:GT2 family glycosyltransferase/2-polyprenyl-3-methyl-5-hydroxy-6-metoxy-1,4-benzoquinol methylase
VTVTHALSADDLCVIIPTSGRWPILQRTIDALGRQTVAGFEVLVVVDGPDLDPPAPDGARVVTKEKGGPGAARNHGVAQTQRRLVLFLGDDMIPDPTLVQRHLERHARHPEPEVAVLGHVEWHDEVQQTPMMNWLHWSGSQFDFGSISGDTANWAHFYSCNTSLKREFFQRVGGFDEDFAFDYEDLDIGYRLGQAGLRLCYARDAVARHLHDYDWDGLRRRFESRATAERLMQSKHDWFSPYFHGRFQWAENQPRRAKAWTVLADRVQRGGGRIGDAVRKRANGWYHQQLAGAFLTRWDGERDLEELQAYLGDEYDHTLLQDHVRRVEAEEEAAPDEATFYRTSTMYLYDLTVFAMSGTKRPYLRDLRAFVPPGSSLLDWGAGIGSDGLRLLERGYRVAFAEFDNPSAKYLRWRLERRGLEAEVHDLDGYVPGGFDAAYSLDVIEHVDDPFAFLAELERRAGIVMVNLLEEEPHDTHLHKPLPIGAILDHAARRGLLRYRLYHRRSHLVIYRSGSPSAVAHLRSQWQRRAGRHLPARPA